MIMRVEENWNKFIRIIRIAIIQTMSYHNSGRPHLSGRILIITKLLVANAYGFAEYRQWKKTLYTFWAGIFLLFVAGLVILFFTESYIGRKANNKLDQPTRKRHNFDIAFNSIWIAPALFGKNFPFEAGS